MKRLRIGRRRARDVVSSSPLELALAPALVEGRWEVPQRFNFTRDVVEALAAEPKRRALTFLAKDGVIEPRSFLQLADGAARWAALLRETGVQPGDRVAAVLRANGDWIEVLLGSLKVGAVAVPCRPTASYDTLRSRLATAAPAVVVGDADDGTLESLAGDLDVPYLGHDAAGQDDVDDVPTEDTAARDLAFLCWTSGTTGEPRPVAHTHGSTFAARVAAEHWLQAAPGDVVWCTPACGTAQLVSAVLGAWARGAQVVLADGEFTPSDRLDLIHRLSASIVCSTPAEYRSLVGLRELPRFRSPVLRRLVSTGDHLEPDVVAAFEDVWGMTIHEGYCQTETGIVVASAGGEDGSKAGTIGRPLPGQQVGVIDQQGNEVERGTPGDLAVRGRPPTLFAGYWDSPEDTKDAFRGDWYLTGDVAVADEDGFVTFVGRADDVISSLGIAFGPRDVERTLRDHDVVAASAVVGLRDLQRGGQFVRAFVVLERGVEGTEQLGAELRAFAARALPEQQVPREVEFVDELPASATGAVRRSELRERPITGRPLWELPPTSEPESFAPAPEAPFASPFVRPPEPEPLPEYVVPSSTPDPVQNDAFVQDPVAPPEPPQTPAMPQYVVDRADASSGFAEPEPPAALVEPEAPAAPVEPEAPAAFVEPEAPAEPAEAPEPGPVEEPELAVETAVEPENVPVAPDPEPEPSPEAGPLPEYIVDPETLPETPPVVPSALEPEPPEAAGLPEYVVDPATVPEAPPVAAEPEPEPEIETGPLPEYVVDPETAPEPVAFTPSSGLEHEPEPDSGPLPEYVVDPERAAESQPEPLLRPPAADPSAPEPPPIPLSDLTLKPVEFPTAGESGGGGKPKRGRGRRQGPSEAPKKAPRERSLGDPGDEPTEIGWMQGLSNRLSAYSVTDDEPEPAPADDDSPDDAETA